MSDTTAADNAPAETTAAPSTVGDAPTHEAAGPEVSIELVEAELADAIAVLQKACEGPPLGKDHPITVAILDLLLHLQGRLLELERQTSAANG